MSEMIDDFWKSNGTMQKVANVASSASNLNSSSGSSRFGAIGSLIASIMSFFV